jgi:tRNA U34 5-methylaminomethyl-2-thiouridine-forming methyltransferase MnmC
MVIDQPHALDWRGGVPVSRRFDDPFYSLENGLAEARHVFLGGNDLPARFRDGFHIAELGFGTGLNFAATALAWRQAGVTGHLHFTSFEAYPLAPEDVRLALARFPEVGDIAPVIEAALDSRSCVADLGITLSVVIGDARRTVPVWDGRADAWFLDGFAPARNPELWEEPLLNAAASRTAPGGTCATYSAAGAVRRALASAGFDVERRPGFGRKRHMSVGRMP